MPAANSSPEDSVAAQPPCDLVGEERVLSSILKKPELIADLALQPADFYAAQHADIFAAMQRLYANGRPIDSATVHSELGTASDIGLKDIAAIDGVLPTPTHAGYFAEIIREHARRRQLIDQAQRLVEAAWHGRDTSVAAAAIAELHAARPSKDWPEPEDRSSALLSALGDREYVEDLVRPGRITVWAAEEGSGKSYTVDDELGIRLAVAGGTLAETWRVIARGPVLVLSEMHPDDDYERERTVLAALGLDRAALSGRYFRLPLMTAAGGDPPLMVPAWREWFVAWCRDHNIDVAIFDTATGATQVDPWGKDIQAVFRALRGLLEQYPALAVVLVVHCKKPQGRGERRISDVLGEWGRWCDVVVLQERDGLDRARLTSFKRVRHMRRIVATQRDGLLVEAKDISQGNQTKVPLDKAFEVVRANPRITVTDLAKQLGVVKRTAERYAEALSRSGRIREEEGLPRGTTYLVAVETTETARHTETQSSVSVVGDSVGQRPRQRDTTYIGVSVTDSVTVPVDDAFYAAWAEEEEEGRA